MGYAVVVQMGGIGKTWPKRVDRKEIKIKGYLAMRDYQGNVSDVQENEVGRKGNR